jgi:hypothetical protein
MFVDDVYQDMDTSALDPTIVRVKWNGADSVGWIKYNNLTLEQRLIDASPYEPFLDAWVTARLAAVPPPSLTEAKLIKVNLIGWIFDIKRQAPYAHTIAAGAFSWDATDGTIAAMSIATIPAIITSLSATFGTGNSLVSQLNANYAQQASEINANIDHDNTLSGGVDARFNQVNATVVNDANARFSDCNTRFSEVNNNVVAPGNTALVHLDDVVIGLVGSGNTINNQLQGASFTGASAGETAAKPGLGGQIAPILTRLSNIGSVGGIGSISGGMGIAFAHISVLTVSPGGGLGNPLDFTIPWTPIGQSDTVNVKLSEMGDIMNGVAGRRATLLQTKVAKTNEVNALTDINDVIAYSATAGWPS